METIRTGDVTITSIIELDRRWRKPADMLPAYNEAAGKRHLAGLEPESFGLATGLIHFPSPTTGLVAPDGNRFTWKFVR